MKEVIFVIGVAGSGKSTYIKNNYPDYKKIDLYDYQTHFMCVAEVLKSYEDCKQDLIESIKTCDKVVMEHTLLKKMRRIPYIDAVRETDEVKLTCVLVNPSVEQIVNNRIARGLSKTICNKESVLDELEVLEIPEDGDGFDEIVIVENFDIGDK